jgi:peptidyl-prolyl cis-trans isomerase D
MLLVCTQQSKIIDVSVSDAEIVDYMKKNEKKFKTDETREVEYVLIETKLQRRRSRSKTKSINC